MIELRKNELRVDEVVLKHATSEEKETLYRIAEAIAKRVKEKGGK